MDSRETVTHSRGSDNRLVAALFWIVVAIVITLVGLLSKSRHAHRRLDGEKGGGLKRWYSVPLPWPEPYSPAGQLLRTGLALAAYWSFLCFLLLFRIVGGSGVETVAFRFGWLGLAHVPLVVLAVSQLNVISLATGISHRRLRWMHRWVARTFFLLCTVHGVLFLVEWIPDDFFWTELKIVPRVKHGIFAWALLSWMAISSLSPVRGLSYEFFIFQHAASAVAFILLLHWHLLKQSEPSIYCAAAVVCLDWVLRVFGFAYRNLGRHVPTCCGRPRWGYEATVIADSEGVTALWVNGIHFDWKPGQHVFVWTPQFWLQSSHPFTIVNVHDQDPNQCRRILLVMQTKHGFTKKLNRFAHGRGSGEESRTLRVFISGPFGQSGADLGLSETLVFISASTGSSYNLPLIESLAVGSEDTVARSVHVLLVARRKAHLDVYLQRLRSVLRNGVGSGLVFHVRIAITAQAELGSQDDEHARLVEAGSEEDVEAGSERSDELRNSGDSFLNRPGEPCGSDTFSGSDNEQDVEIGNGEGANFHFPETTGRPDLGEYFDDIMDMACGRIDVYVCGGKSIVDGTRESLAKVSHLRRQTNVFLHVEGQG
ncbi:ferric reductase like transmembrane component-domain-containing protein [Diplogelasinospora grovesii]|uniref:ferric-chelate reductase (NADPH) n=1 Tax=Diplogelasinospora grovesii TaxID=303347 RepID=A0AAN6S3K7_9PEZI|nr:ferric reductase like transmembrane component-domain-containing protein [Diplogelasinospora grovesii]